NGRIEGIAIGSLQDAAQHALLQFGLGLVALEKDGDYRGFLCRQNQTEHLTLQGPAKQPARTDGSQLHLLRQRLLPVEILGLLEAVDVEELNLTTLGIAKHVFWSEA